MDSCISGEMLTRRTSLQTGINSVDRRRSMALNSHRAIRWTL
jgi:hypothetical protein